MGGIFAGGLFSVLLAVLVLPRSASIESLREMKKALKSLHDLNREVGQQGLGLGWAPLGAAGERLGRGWGHAVVVRVDGCEGVAEQPRFRGSKPAPSVNLFWAFVLMRRCGR